MIFNYLIQIKDNIESVAIKKTFYVVKSTKEPIYILILIDKDGYRMQTEMPLEILKSEINDILKFLKKNGFKIHEDSLFR